MLVEVHILINASKSAVWKSISEIEIAASFIRGIKRIEVLEMPAS